MKLLRYTILALLLQTGAAAAADSNSRFAMKGAGFLPCQVFVQARADQSNLYYMIGGWVQGYLSAHNRHARDTFDILSFESLELLLTVIQTHCAANPGHRLHAVLDSVIASLQPDRLTEASPRVQIAEGKRKTALHRATIRRVQARLADLGLYDASVDGRFTEATKAALMAFQSDLDFETTGFPDQTTLWRLLR